MQTSILRENLETKGISLVTALNNSLASHLNSSLHGNISVTDVINKPSGTYTGIKYHVGESGRALRYNLKNGSLAQIDFWLVPAVEPQYTLNVKGFPNVLSVVSVAADFLVTGDIKQFYFMPNVSESIDKTAVDRLVQKIDKNSSIYTWLGNMSHNDTGLLKTLEKMKILPLWEIHSAWATKNGKTTYNYNQFKTMLRKGFADSKFGEQITVTIGKAEKETTGFVSEEDEDAFAKAMEDFKLTTEEIFDQISTYTESCAKGSDYSLIIAGDPGVGKTYSVEKKLQELGFTKISQEALPSTEDFDDEDAPKVGRTQYLFISGRITPFGLYTLLFEYNNALIVFDDCDSMFDSTDGQNLIKNATDDKLVRTVGMRNANTTRSSSTIPPSFDYTGRIIFITNKYLDDIDSAIKSRALIVEVNLDQEEIITRIRSVMKNLLKDRPEATMEVKKEVLDFLLSIKNLYTKLDFRTYEQAVKEYLRGAPNWKKLVARSIMLKRGV